MSVSTYKRWMKESYLYEADGIDRDNEKKDSDADKVGRDDGDTWTSPSGKYGGKYKGKIEYFDDEDSAKGYAKSGSAETGDGEKEKPKAEPKKASISATGGFADDEEPKDEPGKANKDTSYLSIEKDATSWEYAEEDSESARYSGTLDDYSGLEGRVEDIVTRISSGQSSDEEIEKAEQMADNFEKAGDLNDEGGDDFEDLGVELRAGLDKHHSMKNSKKESIKVINGKKYRAIQESVNKRISVKEVHKWLKGLEEYRYRKIPGVDARRITSFVNNGLSETDLPKSLQKKWESAKYSREKHLADKFVKERISRKLARNESNHPLKEQYNKLFKNKVVL